MANRALVLGLVVACGSPAAHQAAVVSTGPACTVELDTVGGKLSIDGVALPDYRAATLRSVLGEPDRIERVEREGWYEESGEDPSSGWTSTEYTATDHHHVYDRRGLVFHTRNGFMQAGTDPEQLLVFFASPRTFDNTEPPAIVPAKRGGCRLSINGIVLDPTADLRPRGIDYRTERFPLFGTTFAPTSFTTIIDSLYTVDGARSIRIYLDAPATGRASYAEVR